MDEHVQARSKLRTDTPKPVAADGFIRLLCKTFQTYVQKIKCYLRETFTKF